MNPAAKFILILGPMFACKSETLIRYFRRYKIAGKKCLAIKYAGDNRYEETSIVTHDRQKIEALPANKLSELQEKVREYDVICIDEIQFFEDGILCDDWANQGKIVVASGLSGTFQRRPWKIISDLVPLADDIIHLKAVCKDTGEDAAFTHRTAEGDSEVMIGGSEAYSALDRKTFYAKNFYKYCPELLIEAIRHSAPLTKAVDKPDQKASVRRAVISLINFGGAQDSSCGGGVKMTILAANNNFMRFTGPSMGPSRMELDAYADYEMKIGRVEEYFYRDKFGIFPSKEIEKNTEPKNEPKCVPRIAELD